MTITYIYILHIVMIRIIYDIFMYIYTYICPPSIPIITLLHSSGGKTHPGHRGGDDSRLSSDFRWIMMDQSWLIKNMYIYIWIDGYRHIDNQIYRYRLIWITSVWLLQGRLEAIESWPFSWIFLCQVE